ncbi:MAG: lipopolysaccharide biosynthesis protein [Rikenellaceae bacterium]
MIVSLFSNLMRLPYIVVGLVAFVVFFISAPLIAHFFDLPVLAPLSRAVSSIVFFNSLGVVQQAILTSKIDFKIQAKISLGASIISGLVGLTLAYLDYGVWALAIQMIAASVVRLLALWVFVRWRPTMPFSRKSFDELFGYGSKLLLSSLIALTYSNIYSIVIGKVYSPSTLGQYSRADQFARFPSVNITGIMQRVTFPILSTIQNDIERLENSYRRLMGMSAFIVFPLMMGLSALAEPIIKIVLTDKWIGAVPILQVICFSLLWNPIHALNTNLLQVKGRSDLFLRLEIVKKVIGVIIIGITFSHGVMVMCYGELVLGLICLFINTYYTGKIINVSFIMQIRDLFPTFIRSFIMWIIIYFTIPFVNSDILKLVVGIMVGSAFYFLIAFLFKSKDLVSLLEISKNIKR